MDIKAFCSQTNVIIVTGKGGTGKTTIAATLAQLAYEQGQRVLVVATDDSEHLHRLFDAAPLGDNESVLSASQAGRPGRIHGRIIRADVVLSEYLSEHRLAGIVSKFIDLASLDVIATAAPGLRELLVLEKLRQLEQTNDADLIIFDAPATGHALTLLTSPVGFVDAVRSGPLHAQATAIVSFLHDPKRCRALLVAIPEETPINETIEVAYKLEDDASIILGPVIVNSCYPVLDHLNDDPEEAARDAGITSVHTSDIARLRDAAQFRQARQTLQREQCERLATSLPLAQLRLPHIFATALQHTHIEELAIALSKAIEQL